MFFLMCDVTPLSGIISSLLVTGDFLSSGEVGKHTISMQCLATLMNFLIIPSDAIRSKASRMPLILMKT